MAEVEYTAFTSRSKDQHVTARLMVRRVTRVNPSPCRPGKPRCSATHRQPRRVYQPTVVDAGRRSLPPGSRYRRASHRRPESGPLAHAPSGDFGANGAWTVLAAIAYNMTRAAAALASSRHARARLATIRAELINILARIANRARRLRSHLLTNWPWLSASPRTHETAGAGLDEQ